jgi:hypothetical protein
LEPPETLRNFQKIKNSNKTICGTICDQLA